MIKLKKCPFCGGDAKIEWYTDKYETWGTYPDKSPKGAEFFITCGGCGIATDSYLTPRVIAERWNRRESDNG